MLSRPAAPCLVSDEPACRGSLWQSRGTPTQCLITLQAETRALLHCFTPVQQSHVDLAVVIAVAKIVEIVSRR